MKGLGLDTDRAGRDEVLECPVSARPPELVLDESDGAADARIA